MTTAWQILYAKNPGVIGAGPMASVREAALLTIERRKLPPDGEAGA